MAVNFVEISLTRIIVETGYGFGYAREFRVRFASYFKTYETVGFRLIHVTSIIFDIIVKTILIEDKQILNILHYVRNEH